LLPCRWATAIGELMVPQLRVVEEVKNGVHDPSILRDFVGAKIAFATVHPP
jgi:hypothetical protein